MPLLLLSCSEKTNPLRLSTPPTHLNSFEVQLALAKAYLDENDSDNAAFHGEIAYNLNPNSEDAAITYGYALLAKNGLSTFDIVTKLQTSAKNKESGTSSTPSSAFGPLDSILNLNDEAFSHLGTINTNIPDIPIIEPVCAQVPRNEVGILKNVNRAIVAICKFVDPGARVAGDWRHECETNNKNRRRKTEANFLWVITHMTEAIAFNRVINYQTIDKDKTNLELRLARLQDFDPTDVSQISNYVTNIADFSDTITKILDVDGGTCAGDDSQSEFLALINDLMATSAALSAMPHVPASITKSVAKVTDKVRNVQNQSKNAGSKVGEANSFKENATKNMTTELSKKIAGIDTTKLDSTQKTQICDAYAQVSGSPVDDPNLPEVCK